MSTYQDFLAAKAIEAPMRGLSSVPPLAGHLFPFQRDAVAFGLRAGSWGCFFDTGLGKTRTQLEWCAHAAEATNGRALILTPLAVARQIEREGQSCGYSVRVVRSAEDVCEGINVCNYDRLHLLDPDDFGAVSLDEASILKSFTGVTTRTLIRLFLAHRWRMVATATPAPNDHMELGQYAEFLGLMASSEMLMRWFVSDQTEMGRYRLKHHGVEAFWDWMASWARMAAHPRDLGDPVSGFDLPPMKVYRHTVDHAPVAAPEDSLFGGMVSATELHTLKRQTMQARAQAVAELVIAASDAPWVVWCDTDYEADALLRAMRGLAGLAEVRGSQTIERKEDTLAAFADGTVRILIAKPSQCGHGLNWQHAHQMAFVGRNFSYENYYQAVRRCWRFGQQSPVDVHLIVAEGEDAIGRVIDRKADDHVQMKVAMVAAMRRAIGADALTKQKYLPTHEGTLPAWL